MVKSVPFKEGDASIVSLGSTKILNGYIDTLEAGVTKDFANIKITGRSKTADLIDCSSLVDTGEFNNLTPVEIIKKQVAPFGINVIDKTTGQSPIKKWNIDIGESVFENIELLARQNGIILITTPNGDLCLEIASSEKMDIILNPSNIKEIKKVSTLSNRYSEIRVIGQNVDSLLEVEGIHSDSEITRYRPYTIISEGPLNPAQASTRAQWESSFKKSKGEVLKVTLDSFVYSEKEEIWDFNKIVEVNYPYLDIDSDFFYFRSRNETFRNSWQYNCIRINRNKRV